jgi:hypothetical protein
MSNVTNAFDTNWATTKPRHGELKNMPVPPRGVSSVKIKDADNFIYLHLNFISETKSLRGQTLNTDGDYVVTSYGTPIGIIVRGKHYINSTIYSKTTSSHVRLLNDAWSSYDPTWVRAEYFPQVVI